MPLHPTVVPPADALPALAAAIDAAKGGDPLAGVTVIVPTNQSGVMARRALGREQSSWPAPRSPPPTGAPRRTPSST
jgi:hypothetical protein